ncbi:MAG: hypothetical protein WCF90_05385 [Methanomicrobiales archaeon]
MYLGATTKASQVVKVIMGQETGPVGFVGVTVFFLATVILLVFGWVVYREYAKRKLPTPDARTGSLGQVFDLRNEAELLLNEVVLSSDQHRYTDACGKAGRALIVYLSCELGNRGEVTTPENVLLSGMSVRDTGQIEAMLRRCDDLVFVRQEPEDAELSSMISRIREIITTTGPQKITGRKYFIKHHMVTGNYFSVARVKDPFCFF